MKYMLAICAAMIMLAVLETCEKEPERAAFTVTPAQPDTLVLFKNDDVDPNRKSSLEAAYELSDSLSRDYRARMNQADKELRETFPDVGWKRVREWSSVAGCSIVVELYYETSDSSLWIFSENPDTLYKRAGIRIPRRK